MSLKATLRNRDGSPRRAFEGVIIALIVLSLTAFAVETLPNLPPWLRTGLKAFEIFTVAVFTLEYLTRIWMAEKKLAFVFSFFGLIDLLAILPFLLGFLHMDLDLRGLRCFRLIRLVRILKLARYSRALQRFQRALIISREELILFFSVALLLLYFTAVGIYHFEHEAQPEAFSSVFHGLWWALVTLTTVGYGDVVPITVGGRFFTFVLLMLGLGIFSIPAGLLASALSIARMEDEKERHEKTHGAKAAPEDGDP